MANEPIYIEVGRAIAFARSVRGWSQAQLGRRCNLTRAAISLTEQGRTRVQLHNLDSIAKALGVAIERLLPQAHRRG